MALIRKVGFLALLSPGDLQQLFIRNRKIGKNLCTKFYPGKERKLFNICALKWSDYGILVSFLSILVILSEEE